MTERPLSSDGIPTRSATLAQRFIDLFPGGGEKAARALGRLSRGRIRSVVNQATFHLDLRESIQRRMFLGSYEPAQTEWVEQCVKPGDVVVDVGASFGYYATLAASLVGSTGRVFAFEPSPIACSVLQEAIDLSALSQVTLVRSVVGSTAGTIALHLPNTPHLHSPSVLPTDRTFRPIDVPMLALDEFAPLANRTVQLIKIDVEGYEPDVLRGMARLMRSGRIRNIICEFNSWWLGQNHSTPDQLHEMFAAEGFHVREATTLERNLAGHHGARFDLQDRWYARD